MNYFMVSWVHGFMVVVSGLGVMMITWFHGFMVSWVHGCGFMLESHDDQMVSWLLCYSFPGHMRQKNHIDKMSRPNNETMKP